MELLERVEQLEAHVALLVENQKSLTALLEKLQGEIDNKVEALLDATAANVGMIRRMAGEDGGVG